MPTVDRSEQLCELLLVSCVLDLWELSQLSKGVHIPVPHLDRHEGWKLFVNALLGVTAVR